MNIMNGAGKTPLDVALAAKDKLYLRFPKQDSMQSWLFISTDEGTEVPGTSDYQSDKFGAEDLEPHMSSSSEDEVQPSSLEEKKAIESEMEQLLKSVGAVRAESIQRDLQYQFYLKPLHENLSVEQLLIGKAKRVVHFTKI